MIHKKTRGVPRTIEMGRTLAVYVHDDAQMCVPKSDWLWQLRYGVEQSPKGQCDDRILAAGMGESYRYLIMECSNDEAIHRLMMLRRAIRKYDKPTC